MSRISKDLAAHHSYSRTALRPLSTQRSAVARMPHVAVVGAGLAGLRCADVLLRNGTKVSIFEARDRIGGRLHQHKTGQHVFDMGPNWIHGTEGNPMMKLAEKTGTIILEPEEKQIVFDTNGCQKSEEEAFELGAETWATIVDAFKYSNEHHSEIDPQLSLLDFFRDKLTKQFPHNEALVQEHLREARMWGPFVGDPIDRQSLRNFFLEECLEGENVIVASTYSKILAEVARKAKEEAQWHLKEEIVAIEYRDSSNSKSQVVLTTAGGERYLFDEVVVTCPLGWLKHNKDTAFSPKLPTRLSEAIENISYGHLEKVYVSYPSAWWVGKTSDSMTNGVSCANDTASSGNGIPLFSHFHHPVYHPDPASKKNEFWNQALVSLAHFPGSTAQPTLLFYMYGPCSLYITSMIAPHAAGSKTYNSLLYRFLEPFISRLPNHSSTDAACTPTSIVATQWSDDPHAGFGSYSNFQVGLVHGEEDIKCMREAGGLGDEGRGLWLAGEHTAPFVAIGTTTGAYWSGEGAARRILNRYGVEDVKTGDEDLNSVVGEGKAKEMDGHVKDAANLTGLGI